MGLDVYVMPIWKFLSGNYVSPIEQVLGASGYHRIGSAKPSESLEAARAIEEDLQRLFPGDPGDQGAWSMEDCVPFAEQFAVGYDGLHALRSFAAHIDHPPRRGWLGREARPFELLPDPSAYPPLRRVYEGGSTTFAHLIRHEDNAGFYLPVCFKDPVTTDQGVPYGIGSSTRLKAEILRLGEHLPGASAWDAPTEDYSADGLDDLRYAYAFLLKAAETSLEHRLPIVFDG